MTKVTINTELTLSTQQLISAAAQLNTDDLEVFFTRIGELLQQRQQNAPTLTLASSAYNTDAMTEPVPNIPVVEALIPSSITLDSSDVSL